jgi:hypothetical protein
MGKALGLINSTSKKKKVENVVSSNLGKEQLVWCNSHHFSSEDTNFLLFFHGVLLNKYYYLMS